MPTSMYVQHYGVHTSTVSPQQAVDYLPTILGLLSLINSRFATIGDGLQAIAPTVKNIKGRRHIDDDFTNDGSERQRTLA